MLAIHVWSTKGVPHRSLRFCQALQLACWHEVFCNDQLLLMIFTARRNALRGLIVIVILSVRPSICHTRGLCPHVMARRTIMISLSYGSPMILVFGDITFIPEFEESRPERGR